MTGNPEHQKPSGQEDGDVEVPREGAVLQVTELLTGYEMTGRV